MPYLGELSALTTAVMWALSGVTFGVSTKAVGGFATNHFRIWLALPILIVMVWATSGQLWPVGADTERTLLLFLSGFVGLVIGDIGYFHALATIGPRLAAVLMATWPVMALLFTPMTDGEFEVGTLPGVLLTVVGVVLVLSRGREGAVWNPKTTPRQRWIGILGALLAALGQAGGIVIARVAMQKTADLPDGVDPMGATMLRMIAAVAGMQVVAMVRRRPAAGLAVTKDRRALRGAVLGTMFGPVLGVWLSMMAIAHCEQVGVAAALMAVTPLFMVPLARIAYGARVGLVGWVGTLLTVGGAMWLLLATSPDS